MIFDLNKLKFSQAGNTSAKKAEFNKEKDKALNAAQGLSGLSLKINAVAPNDNSLKDGNSIEELERLMLEAIQSNVSPAPPQNRTLGIG